MITAKFPPFTNDPVNSPKHYQSASGIECIDAIEAALTPEEFRGYCKGNAMKYLWREKNKGGDTDALKANWYLVRLTQSPKPAPDAVIFDAPPLSPEQIALLDRADSVEVD
jgi:hypothetical protein